MSNNEEHKSAERQMSELVPIIESSDDAIVSKSLEGIVTSWNKGAEPLFGYRAEEIKTHAALTNGGHQEELRAWFELQR